jgi:hypothetical protein
VIRCCKKTMVCNEWWLHDINCYVSQKPSSWDCDVWHNRHLDLKNWVLTHDNIKGKDQYIYRYYHWVNSMRCFYIQCSATQSLEAPSSISNLKWVNLQQGTMVGAIPEDGYVWRSAMRSPVPQINQNTQRSQSSEALSFISYMWGVNLQQGTMVHVKVNISKKIHNPKSITVKTYKCTHVRRFPWYLVHPPINVAHNTDKQVASPDMKVSLT